MQIETMANTVSHFANTRLPSVNIKVKAYHEPRDPFANNKFHLRSVSPDNL